MTPEVRELLIHHEPATADEARFRERMLALAGSPRPFDRHGFDPGHFTASAFVLSPDRDAVLLIFHRKLERWLQPGGHVESGDSSMLEAARREVTEEVGVAELDELPGLPPLFDLDVHKIPAWASEPSHEHFDLRFVFMARSRDFASSDEVADAKWATLAEIAVMTDDESVRRAVRKLGPAALASSRTG